MKKLSNKKNYFDKKLRSAYELHYENESRNTHMTFQFSYSRPFNLNKKSAESIIRFLQWLIDSEKLK